MKVKHWTSPFIIFSIAVGIYATSSASAGTSVGDSNNPEAVKLFDAASKKMSSGDNAGAAADLTRAIAIDPHFYKAIANRACARFNIRDYKGALADLDAVQKYLPHQPALDNVRQLAERALASSPDPQTPPRINRQQANNMLMQAMLGGDLADPSTLLMMQAQRAGLMGGTGAGGGVRRPVVNPFAAHPLTSGTPVDLTPGVTRQEVQRGDGQTNTSAGSSPFTVDSGSSGERHAESNDPGSDRPFQVHEGAPADQSDNRVATSADNTRFDQDNRHASSGGHGQLDQVNNQAVTSGGNEAAAKEYYDRGCQHNAKQDFANAIPEFDRSIALNPNFGDAWANRGLARFHVQDFRGALKDFEEADRLIPNNAQLKNFIHLARQALGQSPP